ncbi:hypothetical protein HB912_07235 [Listeria aquatica]|uniref:Uncharacterized protein n=1 Tax=Listeria aquatica TaxID=1494960 RepID=A0A841ZPI5_9LIST|nr:hypothetical protein [Listeria aquatica]MBC1521437.1 hypothetical protein [Listeria aquatica]
MKKTFFKKWWFWSIIIIIACVIPSAFWYTQVYSSAWGKGLSKEDINALEEANTSMMQFNKYAEEAKDGIELFELNANTDPQSITEPFKKMGDLITQQSDDYIKSYNKYSSAVQSTLKDNHTKIVKMRQDVKSQQNEIKEIYNNAHDYNRNLSSEESKIVDNIYKAMQEEHVQSTSFNNYEFKKNAILNDKAKKIVSYYREN